MRVEAVGADRSAFLRYLAADPLRNAFALHDLQEEGDRTRCFAAREGGSFRGYLLAWHGRQYPSVVVTGTTEAAQTLLPRAPPSPCTFLLLPELATLVEARREIATRRLMDFMVVDPASFRPAAAREAEPLGKEDAEALEALYRETVEERRDWGRWAGRGIAYGIRRAGGLVAAAGTHFVSRDTSLIGGVYTSPAFRRRGHALAATSAVTQEALIRGERVGLMVVTTNRPAIALYEKLGYRKTVRWAWLDSGTGQIPLA
ncbi:MAG: GNAT family N-acetyltransferase [Thermoplasmata archaeon]